MGLEAGSRFLSKAFLGKGVSWPSSSKVPQQGLFTAGRLPPNPGELQWLHPLCGLPTGGPMSEAHRAAVTHGFILCHLSGRFPDSAGWRGQGKAGREWTRPKPKPAAEGKSLEAPSSPQQRPPVRELPCVLQPHLQLCSRWRLGNQTQQCWNLRDATAG